MGISLGIDFNRSRIIVCRYDDVKDVSEIVFNQPACVAYDKLKEDFCFGEEALRKANNNYYEFKSSIFDCELSDVRKVAGKLFDKIVDSLNLKAFEKVSHIIMTDLGKQSKFFDKDLVPILKERYEQFSDTIITPMRRSQLLNMGIVNALNNNKSKDKGINKAKLLIVNLDDAEYSYSLIDYEKGQKIPEEIPNVSYIDERKGNDELIGSFGFLEALLKAGMRGTSKELNNYKKSHVYQALMNLESKLKGNDSNFKLLVDDKASFFGINKDTFKFNDDCLDEALYDYVYNGDIRRFLKKAKQDADKYCKNKDYKVIYYGRVTLYSEVLALFYSVFGNRQILPFDRIFNISKENFESIDTALGAAYMVRNVFKLDVPTISYTDYKGIDRVLLDSGDGNIFMLNKKEKGKYFYESNIKYELPLSTILGESKGDMKIKINKKTFNLVDELYNSETKRLNGYVNKDLSKDIIISTVRIKLVENDKKVSVIFDFSHESEKSDLQIEKEV